MPVGADERQLIISHESGPHDPNRDQACHAVICDPLSVLDIRSCFDRIAVVSFRCAFQATIRHNRHDS